jgi:hypothetical protein
MPKVGFEPMTPAFERAKMVHALDRVATVIAFVCFFFSVGYNGNTIKVSDWIVIPFNF